VQDLHHLIATAASKNLTPQGLSCRLAAGVLQNILLLTIELAEKLVAGEWR